MEADLSCALLSMQPCCYWFPTSYCCVNKKIKMESSIALTFAEGFLEAFPVNVSEDVMWLPVEVSECQLAEELIAAKKTEEDIR